MKKLIGLMIVVVVGALAQTQIDSLRIKNTPEIDVRVYGAKGDGITDDTAAIQAAVNAAAVSGHRTIVFPAGSTYMHMYHLKDGIELPCKTGSTGCAAAAALDLPFIIKGNGAQIAIRSDFNLSATGLFYSNQIDRQAGPTIEDLTIDYDQATSTDLADYTHYPPTFVFPGNYGMVFRNLTIKRAWDGFKFIGVDAGTKNPGQITIEDVRLTAFHYGLELDKVYDSVRINRLHCFPLSLDGSQILAYHNAAVWCMKVGRADDLKISHSLSIGGNAIHFYGTVSGTPFAQIDDFSFDTFGGLRIDNGNVQITNSYFTVAGETARPGIAYYGGKLKVANSWFVQEYPGKRAIDLTFTEKTDQAPYVVNSVQLINNHFRTSYYTGPVV